MVQMTLVVRNMFLPIMGMLGDIESIEINRISRIVEFEEFEDEQKLEDGAKDLGR